MEAVQGLRKARFERETWTYFALLYLHNGRGSYLDSEPLGVLCLVTSARSKGCGSMYKWKPTCRQVIKHHNAGGVDVAFTCQDTIQVPATGNQEATSVPDWESCPIPSKDRKRFILYQQFWQLLKDPVYRSLRYGRRRAQKRSLRQKCEDYAVDSGVLYRKKEKERGEMEFLRVPRGVNKREQMLHSCHLSKESGHLGRDKTREKVSSRFFWKTLMKDVDKFVKTCDVCQSTNGAKFMKTAVPLHPIPIQPSVWHQVGIDLIGPLPKTERGNCYIITLIDYFSKWPEAEPIADKTPRWKMKVKVPDVRIVVSEIEKVIPFTRNKKPLLRVETGFLMSTCILLKLFFKNNSLPLMAGNQLF
eukprot:Em0022g99a